MSELFDPTIASDNPDYLALRDEPRHSDLRESCEQLWRIFSPFSDRDFALQFALQPQQRFWEMYLGARLLQLGHNLQPRSSRDGPDLHLAVDETDIWIEATLPGEGVGADSVPTLDEHSGFVPVPEDRIILRLTNAISEKRQRLDHYLSVGLVKDRDAFVIAISGAGIQMLLLDGPMPAIVKSVYPIGEHQVIIDTNKMEVAKERYATRRVIQKASGAPVSTQSFIDPAYSGISGVIYSPVTITDQSIPPGREFLYVHNHVARVPLHKGWLLAGNECWVDGDQLRFKSV